jgi:hypothetical protein
VLRRARVVAFLFALGTCTVAFAPSALAATPTYDHSFGSASIPSGEPQALATDQSNGDVYAIDQTNGYVRRFDSAGNPKNFTAGPDSGTNTLGAAAGTTAAGTTPFAFFGDQVAVDRSGGATDGDIYVLDQGPTATGEVHIYSNAGAPLGVIDGTDTPNGTFGFGGAPACGIAVDQSNGNLYVGEPGDFTNGNVWRYTPSGGTITESDYSGGITADNELICNVAVAQGTVFAAASTVFGDGSVHAYPTSAFATGSPPHQSGTQIVASGANALDVNPTTGNVYVDLGDHISVFDSTGASVFNFGSSSDFSGSAGVAVKADGTTYVGDTAAHEIDVYSPPQPPTYQSSFGSASIPSGEPQALATDQSNGDVYAIDQTNGYVRRFDSSGAPKNFTAGPDNGTNTLGAVAGTTAAGTTPFTFFDDQVAVDRSGGPADGDIYVLDQGPNSTGEVHVYANSGAPLGVIDGTQTPNGTLGFFAPACGLAVDQANGNLYVGEPGDFSDGNVWRYTPSGGTVSESDYSGSIATTGVLTCNIAVAQGTLYANSSPSFGDGSVHAYPTSAFATGPQPHPAGTQIVTSGATALDANPQSGNVYVDLGNKISVFDPTGASVFDFPSPTGDFGSSAGVAVRGSDGTTYVGDTAAHEIDVFGFGTPPPTPASATTNAASAITHTTATLNGHLDPGTDTSVTDCHFAWVSDAQFQVDHFASAQSAPCAEGNSFTSPADVHADLSGLHPGTTYHYLLDITGSDTGEVTGSDQPFATTAFAGGTDAASAITHTSATLNGHLDPQGDPNVNVTACSFDWGTDTSYGQSAPCAEGNSFAPSQAVSAALSALHPGQSYHFRLHLTLANGDQFTGADKSFAATAFPVSTDPASTIHHTDFIANGHFDPQSDPALDVTACSFDWVSDAQFGVDGFTSASSVPCAEGQSFSSASSVSALINNLTPGTTYHFRLHLQTAGAGTNLGQERTVTPPLFPTVSPQIAAFGPDGTGATSFPSSGPNSILNLAFDQAAQRLYAIGVIAPGIYGFDASAPPAFSPLAAFSPLSTVSPGGSPGLAVDSTGLGSAGNIYFVSENTQEIYGFDSTGTALGGNFPIDPASPGNPGPPEVPDATSKDLCGAAVDSAGNIWVSNFKTKHILEYSSAGAFVSSHDVSSQFPTGGPCPLAFDSHDNLYVGKFLGPTLRFTAASGYTAASQVDSGSAHALAVDPSTDDLYVAHDTNITRYDSAGILQATFAAGISGANFFGVAIGTTSHDVYVADTGNRKIRVFHPTTPHPPTLAPGDPIAVTGGSATLTAKVDPEAIPVTDCHFDWGTDNSYGNTAPCVPDPGAGSGDVSVHADLSGLNGGNTYHFRIAASNAGPGGTATGSDQTLTTPGPAISATSADHVSDSAVTLHASLNPNGHSTTYQFQYTDDVSFQANGFSGAQTAPASPAAVGSGSSAVPVAERVLGLHPDTAYHFRLVAQSSDGTDLGPNASFTTFGSSPPPDTNCSNQQFRTGPSAVLPDCRAYEQASPVDKAGNSVLGGVSFNQAAADGHAAVFSSYQPLPTSGGGSEAPSYVASRGAGGWSYDGALPATDSGSVTELGRDADLKLSLSARTSPAGDSLFSTNLSDFNRAPLLPVPRADHLGKNPQFADDPAHFIFESTDSLAAGAVSGSQNLYDYDHGALTLAGLVPAFPATSCSGAGCVAPAGGSFAGSYNTQGAGDLDVGSGYKQGTISADGSRVFFTEGATGRLYLRQNGTSTTQINADQGGNDPNGHKPASFLAATPDGKTVWLSSCERLTPDSTAVSSAANTCLTSAQGQDLYAYDTSSGDLTDLTADPGAGAKGAQLQGLLGASPDGADVYFVANGDLDGAGPATAGNCDTSSGLTNFTGSCSLYFAHDGNVGFIARLGASPHNPLKDSFDWAPGIDSTANEQKTARVASDGALLFRSVQPLTGYANDGFCGNQNISTGAPPAPGPCAELFRFDPSAGPSGRLDCVSCNPTGAAPIGNASLAGNPKDGLGHLFHEQLGVLTRNLSSDGDRVFFETPDQLVPADTNGEQGCANTGSVPQYRQCQDVYEWEADGSGSCHSTAQNGGCIYLLSSGTSEQPSFFGDASLSGGDAFIFTGSPLVPQDTDQLTDLYDVRVGGGLASQQSTEPPSCTPETCHGSPTPPPSEPTGGGSALAGTGNQGKSRGGTTVTSPGSKKPCKKHRECKKHRKKGRAK